MWDGSDRQFVHFASRKTASRIRVRVFEHFWPLSSASPRRRVCPNQVSDAFLFLTGFISLSVCNELWRRSTIRFLCLRWRPGILHVSFHQNLPRRHRPQGRRWSPLGFHDDRARAMSSRDSTTTFVPGVSPAAVDELEEAGILIQDTRDTQRRADLAIRKTRRRRGSDLALGRRNRIAVRIDAGMAQGGVHLIEHLCR